MSHEKLLIVDFGSQVTQLIARRVREAGVYSEIRPCTASMESIREFAPRGIILSGGPASVHQGSAPKVSKEICNIVCFRRGSRQTREHKKTRVVRQTVIRCRAFQ